MRNLTDFTQGCWGDLSGMISNVQVSQQSIWSHLPDIIPFRKIFIINLSSSVWTHPSFSFLVFHSFCSSTHKAVHPFPFCFSFTQVCPLSHHFLLSHPLLQPLSIPCSSLLIPLFILSVPLDLTELSLHCHLFSRSLLFSICHEWTLGQIPAQNSSS